MIEIFRDRADYYRFRIKAKNNHILAYSEGVYTDRKGCIRGLRSLLSNIGLPENKIEHALDNLKEVEEKIYV